MESTKNALLIFFNKWHFLLLILLAIFPLFYQLDALTIREWDESRLVANTLEMYYNKNYLVTHFDGAADLWNTKPPLLIWLQVGLLHLLGFSEWSIRLPSAIAGLITIIYLYYFVKKQSGNTLFAFLSAFVLITTRGFLDRHVTRTGDYDALLICFAVIALCTFYTSIIERKYKKLYVAALFFGLAVLTKGPAIMLFLPAIFLFLIWTKAWIPLLKNKHFYGAFIVFLLVALPYYLIREQYNPGYLNAVYENELGGRFLKTLEQNSGSWYLYLENMTGRDFNIWFVFILVACYFVWKEKNEKFKDIVIFASIIAVGFLVFISISKTKLGWYDAPSYPFWSIIVAYALFQLLNATSILKKGAKRAAYSFFIVLFLTAYTLLLVENTFAKDKYLGEGRYEASYFIRDRYLKQEKLDSDIFIAQSPHEANTRSGFSSSTLFFYIDLVKQKDRKVHYIEAVSALPTDTKIWVQEDLFWNEVKATYGNRVELIETWHALKEFKIKSN